MNLAVGAIGGLAAITLRRDDAGLGLPPPVAAPFASRSALRPVR